MIKELGNAIVGTVLRVISAAFELGGFELGCLFVVACFVRPDHQAFGFAVLACGTAGALAPVA